MRRLSLIAAGLMLTALNLFAASPAIAQRADAGCAIEAMPALPADASRAAPAARTGFAWEPGAYRCRTGRWEYVPGHWERARRNAAPNPLAYIGVRQGRLYARPGHEIVEQGSGAARQVILRPTGPRGFSVVTGTFTCQCSGTGSGCSITTTGSELYCRSTGCTSCNLVITTGGTAGLRAESYLVPGMAGCGQAGSGQAASGVTARR